ncbi:MAG: hypothetical protein A3A80_02265 [Candidatus Terrybacteria bacterium RIFCSPLOWO2_01_FULL_44_24]|uniref:Uncharacterized protein n=1 Tax=Candidatus Terrybacteria bacterium RIFCSPHIGHO2_01_FULL_43_35 TaxID=1802361 RepID=A0A1G2PEA3_9BACT|nr:MAG: hypothetical protein A2828_02055 [Candidatus Terrybacteria bacterium RIFCSPHIGHO2_01_FULL_43_35]OHA50903.1 MAG: hypothetical protein A3A80_02265 [Candidatus Terrybacteria bacterium RIFCSPLOWO2_01_FULL_44_24]
MLAKRYRIPKIDLKKVFVSKNKVFYKNININFAANKLSHPRFAVYVNMNKSIKGAVGRNRARRILFDEIAKNQKIFVSGFDVLVKARMGTAREQKETRTNLDHALKLITNKNPNV